MFCPSEHCIADRFASVPPWIATWDPIVRLSFTMRCGLSPCSGFKCFKQEYVLGGPTTFADFSIFFPAKHSKLSRNLFHNFCATVHVFTRVGLQMSICLQSQSSTRIQVIRCHFQAKSSKQLFSRRDNNLFALVRAPLVLSNLSNYMKISLF